MIRLSTITVSIPYRFSETASSYRPLDAVNFQSVPRVNTLKQSDALPVHPLSSPLSRKREPSKRMTSSQASEFPWITLSRLSRDVSTPPKARPVRTKCTPEAASLWTTRVPTFMLNTKCNLTRTKPSKPAV
jgi:hypothetical protein